MPSFSAHHCAICHRVGSKRCVQRKHFVECETHGTFYASVGECVQCAEAERRAFRREQTSESGTDLSDETTEPSVVKAKSGKRAKKGKGDSNPVSFKRLKKDLKKRRKVNVAEGGSEP